ncbi:MAG: hypothetical protein IJX99_10105 [Clostridia bacterium]|nr:hypothetical protein [Clostridia bacterium]
MKLRLEVSLLDAFGDSEFLKRMNAFNAQVELDSKKGILQVSNLDASEFDEIVEYIKGTFKVRRVEMIPDERKEPSTVKVMSEDAMEKNSKPQQIEFPRAEFSHKLIEERVNKFLQVAGMAINRNNAEAKSIASFISTAICELAMMYHPHPLVDIKVGDIVTCNYGYHMPGEVSGRYVHSVVCAIDDSLAYVVPITKDARDDGGVKFLSFYSVYDVTYTDPMCKDYAGGSMLLQHGRWLCRERISGVVGYAHPRFMSEILRILPGTLYFAYDGYEQVEEDVSADDEPDDFDITEMEIPELPFLDDESPEVEAKEVAVEEVDVPKCLKNSSLETALYKKFTEGLSRMTKDMSLDYNINFFCEALGLPADEGLLRAALKIVADMEKVSQISIKAIVSKFSLFHETLEQQLQEIWKGWLAKHPEIKEEYPHASFSSICRFFFKLVTIEK